MHTANKTWKSLYGTLAEMFEMNANDFEPLWQLILVIVLSSLDYAAFYRIKG